MRLNRAKQSSIPLGYVGQDKASEEASMKLFSVPRQPAILLFLGIFLLLTIPDVSAQITTISLDATPCIDWEETRTAWDAARSRWTSPDCYDYSSTFLGFQVGTPQSRLVQVRNGVISGGSDHDRTVNDFLNIIESRCLTGCPNQGAERCIISYASEGYPTSIYIDDSRYIADEELIYVLSDFRVVEDCSVTSIRDSSNEALPIIAQREGEACSNWEETQKDLQHARNRWMASECYDFSYAYRHEKTERRRYGFVQVRNGILVHGDLTVEDLFNLIEMHCIAQCPHQGAQLCRVTYAEEGYPTFVMIDSSPFPVDNGSIYELYRFVNCATTPAILDTVEEYPSPDTTPCTNWQETMEQLKAARNTWSSPLCYELSYSNGSGATIAEIRNGIAEYGNSVEDFFDIIERLCISGCPSEGATECDVMYSNEGYPTSIHIDGVGADNDEAIDFSITYRVSQDCRVPNEEESVESINHDADQKCSNYQDVEMGLLRALRRWIEPPCYDFVYQHNSSNEVSVHVREGVADAGLMSIKDWLLDVEARCVINCTESDHDRSGTMHMCEVEYATEGFPMRIEMYPSAKTKHVKEVILIYDYTPFQCKLSDSEPSGENLGSKPDHR